MLGFVLVGGWPAAGKTTLARALASELEFAYLAKDEVKEALMDTLGAPSTVEESRELGRAAVAATLRAARGCRAAVIDSTWFPTSLPLVRELHGPFVEIRCRVHIDVVRRRYRDRARDDRHLDDLRSEEELWGREVAPLGVGPLVDVDTARPVDIHALANRVRFHFESTDT
jgi:predicted kinase